MQVRGPADRRTAYGGVDPLDPLRLSALDCNRVVFASDAIRLTIFARSKVFPSVTEPAAARPARFPNGSATGGSRVRQFARARAHDLSARRRPVPRSPPASVGCAGGAMHRGGLHSDVFGYIVDVPQTLGQPNLSFRTAGPQVAPMA
jgi:hypothetical protein